MAKKVRKKRFILVEVLISLALFSTIIPVVFHFYVGLNRLFEDKIADLQIPQLVDTTFHLIERELSSLVKGKDITRGGEKEEYKESHPKVLPYIYSSRCKEIFVPYSYTAKLLKASSNKNGEGGVRLYLVSLSIALPAPFSEQIEAQRTLCVVY